MIGSDSLPTVSSGIHKLREIISENQAADNVYGSAANGTLPLVVHVENEVGSISIQSFITNNSEYDIMQLIKIKQDYTDVNLVVFGGSGAPLASEPPKEFPLLICSTAC